MERKLKKYADLAALLKRSDNFKRLEAAAFSSMWRMTAPFITYEGVMHFISEIAGNEVSLKDFRTLSACSQALHHLVRLDPKPNQRGKRSQLKSALQEVANDLANTPAVCKRSYVHALVIGAFETGSIEKAHTKRWVKRPIEWASLAKKDTQACECVSSVAWRH